MQRSSNPALQCARVAATIFSTCLGFAAAPSFGDDSSQCPPGLSHRSPQEVLSDHLDIHFLELPKFRLTAEQVKTPLEAWLYFLNHAETLDHLLHQSPHLHRLRSGGKLSGLNSRKFEQLGDHVNELICLHADAMDEAGRHLRLFHGAGLQRIYQ